MYTYAFQQRRSDVGALDVFRHSGRIQVEIAANLVPAEYIEAVRSLSILRQFGERQAGISLWLKGVAPEDGNPAIRIPIGQRIQ
jgi:hypothetical protein